MKPQHGEVWFVDLGMVAKIRPAIVLMPDNLNASRSLIIQVPITKQIVAVNLNCRSVTQASGS